MRIVVDLTPVLPGGHNGGLKPLVLALLRDLIALAPQTEFVLLTSSTTDGELATFDAHNVRRVCVAGPEQKTQPPALAATSRLTFRRRVRFGLARVLPRRLMLGVELAYLAATGQRPRPSRLLTGLQANLLFSPFPGLPFHEPRVPSVSLIHDVQVYHYPRFFRPEERAARHRELLLTARLADRIVCTSAFVYRTVLAEVRVPPSRIVTISPCHAPRLARVEADDLEQVLARRGLARNAFLLYPGNFWPYKNHGMLLTAFGVYRADHPDSSLRLVLPGETGGSFDELVETCRAMGLADRVLFPGFVSDSELAALYRTCRAVIVPTLDEGLSLSVWEALAFNKLVLCAGHTSLQELAGDAAVYFDPRLLSDVVHAIERAADDPGQVQAPGSNVGGSGDATRGAEEYLRLFCEVAA